MSVPEARRVLRRIELEAYASIVSAFRAEGPLTHEKKAALTKLCQLLSISSDRHHAEVRRAICDDQLCYIADCVTGNESKRSWLPEGRRTGGRGNPRLVARHVLSSSLQGQALAAVTASTVKSSLKTEGGGVDESEKKLPPQVQSAIRMITSQHQSSASNTRTQKPSPLPPPPPPPPVSLKSTGSQTDALPSIKPDTTTPHTTPVQSVSIGIQVDLITVDKVDVGTQYELMEDVMEIKEEEDKQQPDINEANEPSSQSILEQTNKALAGNDVSDCTDKPVDSEMIESVQKSLVEISEPESMQDESLLVVDSEIKEIKVEQAPVSSIKVNESKSSSVQSQESDINDTVSVVEFDIIVKPDLLVKNESDTSNVQSAPDHSLKEAPPVTREEEKSASIETTITPTTSSLSINTTASKISSSISTSSTATVTPSPSIKRRPLKRPISSLGHSSPDDIHPPSAKALHIDTTLTTSSTPPSITAPPTTLSTSSTVSISAVSNTIAPTTTPPTTAIAAISISTTSSTTSTQAPVVPASSSTVPASTSEAIVHSPLSDTDDTFSIVSIPVSSITKLPTPKKNPTVVIHSVAPTISDSTNVNTTATTVGSMLYSTAVAALISPSPLSPISPSPFSPSPISSCPLSPSPVPESPPKTFSKSNPPSPSKSSSSQQTNPIIPPVTSQDTTTVNTESTTHSFTATTSTATDITCTGDIDIVAAPSVSIETTCKSLEPAPSSIETVQGLQSESLETAVSILNKEGNEEIKEEIESVHVKEEVFESIEEEEDEKMETEDGTTGNIFDFTSIPSSKGILPLKPELFQTVSSLSSPHREGSSLILSSANPNTITSVPSIEELSSSISSPGGDNLFFPDSAGPHFPPSHSSTPTSPFPSTVIPDENVLLEAVTNELGVDSIDPSLLNMSDLLSLLQPDSDPLDQLALTTEEASSDMIVLQQSDGMNVVQNLDLNINEEELLEGLPQELRDSVQAMLEDQ